MQVRARFVVPAVYLAVALYVWIEFVRTNADGPATLGLFFVTLPVAVLGLGLTEVLRADSFILLPSGFGYYNDYALYFWPSVLITAALLYWLTTAITRRA